MELLGSGAQMLKEDSCMQKPPNLSTVFFNPCKPWATWVASRSQCVISDTLPFKFAVPSSLGADDALMPAQSNKDDVGWGEPSAHSAAS